MFSGNTILGDGAVIMIVDPNGIARLVGAAATDDRCATAPTAMPSRRRRATTMLVFRTGADSIKAVPLSLVTRLEEVDARASSRTAAAASAALPQPPDPDGSGRRRRRSAPRACNRSSSSPTAI
jgi:hypothetical protein